jgi:hypothetical protein
MADGTFFAETDALQERVGTGLLDGSVTVDQVYALYQHEGADFEHPRGGEAFYLRVPLEERTPEMLAAFRAMIEADASAADVMAANMESLADTTPVRAPVEFNVLRQSASPKVEDDGIEVFHRPPKMPRLTQAELDEIRRIGEPIVNPAEWLRQFRFKEHGA